MNWEKSALNVGGAVALAVSRWLPTAATRVRAQVCSCGIRGGQSGIAASFLQALRFPSLLIPPTAPHPSSSGAGTVGQPVAGVPSGLSRASKSTLCIWYHIFRATNCTMDSEMQNICKTFLNNENNKHSIHQITP
jgi:hypothetical protein